MKTQTKNNRASATRDFGVADNHDQLQELTVSQEAFWPRRPIPAVPVTAFLDSNWSRLLDEFYRQRIVHVRCNNLLLLRFGYDYEIDLDSIKTERDLLANNSAFTASEPA